MAEWQRVRNRDSKKKKKWKNDLLTTYMIKMIKSLYSVLWKGNHSFVICDDVQ